MRIALVAPAAVPPTIGGAERALAGTRAAIEELTPHEAELVTVPVVEDNLVDLLAAYETFAHLDLSAYDRIVVAKYPAWMVHHPHKTIWMMHPLRGLYDTYHLLGLPEQVPNPADHTFAMLHLMRQAHHRGAFDEFFERWHNALAALGPDHPDFAFPGPFARTAIRWLDAIAMAPGEVQQYLSLSETVARRERYFPTSVTPRVVPFPGHLEPAEPTDPEVDYLFTCSRLDGPKRHDLLVRAMASVPGDIELRIAGTGPCRAELEALAAGDPRIRFLGRVDDADLPGLYAGALAVPFVPADEDQGLVTLEAFSQGTPVVTCTDAGGPTEFVVDGVTGLVARPTPEAVGAALARLVRDRGLAHQLGEAARAREAQVTWDAAIDALLGEDRYTPEEQAARWEAALRPDPDDPRSPDRVVVLTTFAIDDPSHGGQLRARNLYGNLALHRPVEIVALVDFGLLPSRTELAPGLTQVVVPRSSRHSALGEERSAEVQLPVADLLAARAIDLTPAYLDAVRRAASGASAVILAEPYLLPVLEAAEVDLPVVYDAYNVEAELKASVYPDTPTGRDMLDQVVALERRALEVADRVTTCSTIDLDALASEVGHDLRARVIPNGTVTDVTVPTPLERRAAGRRWLAQYWRAGSAHRRPEHLAVFFGSWHPPNLDAAELLIELAPQIPDVLVLSVGHHGHAFEHRVVPPNLVFAGKVSSRAKDLLLRAADVALNPMRLGSGTNLKLLEYFAVGIPVVSTPFGVRGIDAHDGEHLLLAEPAELAAAVRSVLDDPDAAQARADAARRLVVERYDWRALGADLADVIADIVDPTAPK